MGRNVFVSYKYWDNSVHQFNKDGETIVRDYVDVIVRILGETSEYHYRGERDGEDNSELHYKEVESILSDKIFHTSITIVLISSEMFENATELEQWIPWEISYSLRNKKRYDGDSYMNAILAIVLPNRNNNYSYAIHSIGKKKFIRKEAFFKIISNNMFNRVGWTYEMDEYGNLKYTLKNSYVALARWNDFCSNPDYYLDCALSNRSEWNEFVITKKINRSWRTRG